MPVYLDEMDIAIIKSLLKDGRKSYRQISRETKITTPTVKARFERLTNIGFIKSVIPIFDFNKVNPNYNNATSIHNKKTNTININHDSDCNINNEYDSIYEKETDKIADRITMGLAINIECDFCKGLIDHKPIVSKIVNLERFFCCNSCRIQYIQNTK